MIRHETLNPPPHIYPVNPWKIIETAFYPRFLAQTETIFSVGNGYLGFRGNFEEGRPTVQNGTFINGFHETWPIVYGETAFGFAQTGQTMLNVPDAKVVKLYVDDEPFYLPTAMLQIYERTLDMQSGTLDREVLWETPSGKRVLIESRRLVSLSQRHLAAISFQVTVLNDHAPVVICSEIVGDQPNQSGDKDPRQSKGFIHNPWITEDHYGRKNRLMLSHRVKNSGMVLACGADHHIETECEYSRSSSCDGVYGKVEFSVDARMGKPIQIFKYVAYHTSRGGASPQELCERCERTLDRALKLGFSSLVKEQRTFLDDFWQRADIEIEGDPEKNTRSAGEMQQALRWNLFQILQACARAEGTGIPAKGLTGQTYEGHYFWDTEIYVLPFLTYTTPRIARNLLRFRHSMLDRARKRAREVNQVGALFPWRTINGEEASAYYAAGTAQYHINADIMFALRKYAEITDDKSLLFNEGAEMLVETARLWLDLGFYSERQGGCFCIHSVTGPDEYTTVVNNNAFTNLMARENLWHAAQTVQFMRENFAEHYANLVHRTGLAEKEDQHWQEAADRMFIPYDEELRIHPQDDSFLDREVWDLKKTPKSHFPLLLYYHPLVIYRHQVIKQADVVLAMFLLGDEFTREQKHRNFDYYDPLTTGDSSLSACIQAIVAAEIGDEEKAVKYARYAVLMDLADVGGNVKDGCHIASMGGTWMVAVYGFAGMRDFGGNISFDPRLPEMLKSMRFALTLRGQRLEVKITHEKTQYTLGGGDRLQVTHQGEELTLSIGETIERPNRPPPIPEGHEK
ncbi:glycoside hydrolase family 65 protein [Geoalkalibacter subterraneus]|uniref:Kojibiose phosphorylase n=1 Tax=Geoalkalibacter subterraneus TaxID=483547 RepID=A0A0B5FHY5_9BACT|nr:glycosyl hydrolase family 65 protein [Geoalkalibacter subterraneus]AJF07807.1 kojibiose phosphorylase [Geoalkalibacter subterraneus]